MKKILWISRHQMTHAQKADLERIFGEILIQQYGDTVSDLTSIIPEIGEADVICAVLPPELYQELLSAADGKPVLRAISGRVPSGTFRALPDGRTEEEFTFVHQGWEQILKLEIQTRLL